MKNLPILLIAVTVIIMTSCTQTGNPVPSDTPQLDYLQLQIFNYDSTDQEVVLDTHFHNALIPALHRAGFENIGVFKPINGLNENTNYTILIIPFRSLDQIEELPALLEKDSLYLVADLAYIDAPFDHPPYSRIENIILRSFSTTPKLVTPELDSPRPERVYELRSYQSATEKLYNRKVEMFNEGEIAIFQELDFNPVFFAEVLSSSHMPHLMYMTAHADTTAQKKNWDAFGLHPDWDRMKNLERYQNTVSHIDRYLLYPTDYSDY
jgi:hypothetical protein